MDITCRAPHPAWNRGRDERFIGRVHGAPLPVSFALDIQLKFERWFKADDARPPIPSGQIEVTCAHKDCGAVHLFRVVRAA